MPRTCEQVIAEFASLGIQIECGPLPDGCDGSIECGGCPQGTECGANGQNFQCGCEELTCATAGSGAECGLVSTRCGAPESTIDCGACFGQQVCQGNKCDCPQGVNCTEGCDPTCSQGEVCVDGTCCSPTFPCAENQCSPPGGLDDGCGGITHCPPCGPEQQCVFSEDLVFECLGDCTCEAQGVECGSATLCGTPTLCGTCQDNGFEEGYTCDSGRCVCEDLFEFNDAVQAFSLICGGSTGLRCDQDAWGVNIAATHHQKADIDFYGLEVLDSGTQLVAAVSGLTGAHTVHLTYICPDGTPGILDCKDSSDLIEGIKFCTSDSGAVGLTRSCDKSGESPLGVVLVGVRPLDFSGSCQPYRLDVFATGGTVIAN